MRDVFRGNGGDSLSLEAIFFDRGLKTSPESSQHLSSDQNPCDFP